MATSAKRRSPRAKVPPVEVVPIKRGRGAPQFAPNDDQRSMVQVMVGTLCPQAVIARNIGGGISVNTLKKHFADDLANGREQVVATLKMRMFRASENGSVRATAWLLERLGGPAFASRLRLGGMEDAPPIAVNTSAQVTFFLPDNGRDKNG